MLANNHRLTADGKGFEKLQEKSSAEEAVFMVKGIPLFESDRYKTVIGVHFTSTNNHGKFSKNLVLKF